MPHREVIEFLIKNLNLLGVHPYKQRNYLKNLIIIFPAATIWCLGMYRFFYEDKLTFDIVTNGVETFLTTTHFIYKYIALFVNHHKSRVLIKETEKFVTIPEEFESEFHQSYKRTIRIIKIVRNYFISVGCVASCIVTFIPILLDDLVLACYIPKWINRKFFIYFDCFTFCLTTCVAITYDLFAFTLISLTRLQFKIHNQKIRAFNIEDCARNEKAVLVKMEEWIQFHRFLYNYIDLFNSTFKVPVFLEYVIFISTMCFELYFFSIPGINVVNACKSLIYICGLASQLVIYYCWPAALLAEESLNTVFCLYDLPWYNCKSSKVIKNLLMIMVRAQRETKISAADLFAVDLTTTTQAFKASLSYFTTLKTMELNRK